MIGFSFVKSSRKYYDDASHILASLVARNLAPQLSLSASMLGELTIDADEHQVPTTVGTRMELRCLVAVLRHGDRTPKQKLKMQLRVPRLFDLFRHYDGFVKGEIKLKRPKQLQHVLDTVRALLAESPLQADVAANLHKFEQTRHVLEMHGHFSGINRKVQLKYQPQPPGSCSCSTDSSSMHVHVLQRSRLAHLHANSGTQTSSEPLLQPLHSPPPPQHSERHSIGSVHLLPHELEPSFSSPLQSSATASTTTTTTTTTAAAARERGSESSPEQQGHLLMIVKWGGELTHIGREQARGVH